MTMEFSQITELAEFERNLAPGLRMAFSRVPFWVSLQHALGFEQILCGYRSRISLLRLTEAA